MSWVTGIFIYVLIWWTALFAVLPWGLRHDFNQQNGHATGAPLNPRIRQKFLITSLVAAAIWVAIYGLMKLGIIDFRAISMAMMAEDLHR